MKEFKGTQGKWKLSISKRGRKAHINANDWEMHTKVYVQTQDIEGNYVDSEEGMANAQLIETAPELLEALQIMVFLFNNENIDQQNAKAKAILTINKALGL